MTNILLVEDEASLSEPLAFLLQKEGYSVTIAEDGRRAVDLFEQGKFNLVLLDLMLPELSGVEVCRAIRGSSQVPIIMLTAKDSEVDIVVGLELGADDYVTKPYSSRELLARIKAVLRRQTPSDAGDDYLLKSGHLMLDSDRHTLTVNGTMTAIPLKEFELLEYLMRNAGRVLTRGQIIDRIWGSDYFGDTKTLDVHIKRIRSRIEVDPANPELILTVRGLGYRFEDASSSRT
jgi:two-component system response regulator RegX3